MDDLEKTQLRQRTTERNALLWSLLDWGGLMAPLANQQQILDQLGVPTIENPMAVSDENWAVKEHQRDRNAELEQATVTQSRGIADDKVATGRAKLAIEQAANEYVLAADNYDAKVRGLLMAAREFANIVELRILAVEASQTGLAIAKEELHQAQVRAEQFKEAIATAMVDADIARSKVEAARANVRALEAEVAAGEAEVKAVEAEIAQYEAEAQKATLQADVAMIFAHIMTLQLDAIKLDVGQQEITAGFGYLKSRLDDAIALYDTQQLMEEIKTQAETQIQKEIGLLLTDGKKAEDLRSQAADDAQTAFLYKKKATQAELDQEKLLTDGMNTIDINLANNRTAFNMAKETAMTAANAAVQSAYMTVYHGSTHLLTEVKKSTELISGG